MAHGEKELQAVLAALPEGTLIRFKEKPTTWRKRYNIYAHPWDMVLRKIGPKSVRQLWVANNRLGLWSRDMLVFDLVGRDQAMAMVITKDEFDVLRMAHELTGEVPEICAERLL